ncbi:MAG: TetR/AcrR family transcriptional regulator [Chitinophagales bacterium]
MQYLKDEIKNRIISAALNEFDEKGFSNASMRKIAKDAGIATGNIYRYFDGKDELFYYIMEPVYEQFTKLIFDHYETADLGKNMVSIIADIVDKVMKVYEKYSKEFMILLDKSEGSKYQDIKEDLIILIEERTKKEILPKLADAGIVVADELIFYVGTCTLVEGVFTILRKCKGDNERIKNLIGQLLVLYLNYTSIIERLK